MVHVEVKVLVRAEGGRVVTVIPGIDLIPETVPGPDVDAPGCVVADGDGDGLQPSHLGPDVEANVDLGAFPLSSTGVHDLVTVPRLSSAAKINELGSEVVLSLHPDTEVLSSLAPSQQRHPQ